MITHSDDGPDLEPDDPLAIILQPACAYLGPPPGRYEAIRRGAMRRRLLRAAAGAGLSCAVAALIALPLRLATPDAPASPTVPLAPPPAGSAPAAPEPGSPPPTGRTPTGPAVPTRAPSATPTSPSAQPSAVRSGTGAPPESGTRP